MVKRAYVELRERVGYLKRLAFHPIAESTVQKSICSYLIKSKAGDTDVVMAADEIDVDRQPRARDGCVRYAETIERSNLMSTTYLELAPHTTERIA